MFDGFQLHLIGFCPFAGQDVFPLKIAVHHDDDRFIIVQISDNDGHRIQPRQLTGAFSPVPGYDFISPFLQRPGNRRYEHAIFLDAFHGFHHAVIIHHAKGMVLKGIQLGQRDLLNLFPRTGFPDLLCGEEVIVGGQADVSAAAFQVATPPLSARGRRWRPCRPDRAQRCSCLRR